MKNVIAEVPSISLWTRAVFLNARSKQAEAAKANTTEGVYVIEPDEHILCDWCSAEIMDALITLVDFGSRAVCDKCYLRLHANEEVRWRPMYEDGTLGRPYRK